MDNNNTFKMSNQLDATIAKRLDISVKEGQTFNGRILVTDPDGLPVNLTGVIAKLSVRQQTCGCDGGGCASHAYDEFDQVWKQDFTPTIQSTNQIVFNEPVLLTHGSYKYDLLIEWPTGKKEYFLQGSFKVKRSYAKP